jgi:serine-threonine kinase receptor-associated protein
LSGGDAARAVTGSADFSASVRGEEREKDCTDSKADKAHISTSYSKVWDTYSGTCLHTFSHNHIVRAVAIDSKGTQILTGGHEKKLRLFDLSRPDEEASYLSDASLSSGQAHDGNIKSVVWQRGEGEGTVVSVGEDKIIK